MKKRILALAFALAAVLGMSLTALAGSWNQAALQTQAAQAVPGGQVLSSEADDMGCFVGMQKDGKNYQFTLAGDTDPQMPDAQPLDYKGHKAYFFETMPGAGGLMVLLAPEKSLTILYMAGFDSDTELTAADLTAIADRMDLDKL
ncbi:hypothetical protein ACR42D_01545 [Desulfovibrio caledoniensis]